MESDDLLLKIRTMYEDFSKSEKKVAEFLLAAPDQFVLASVKEVALAVGLSEPTIVRFGRNVGCKGFKDLKIVLARHLAVEQALRDTGNTSEEGSGFINQICSSAVDVVKQAARSINSDDLEKAAKIIAASKRVFIFGIGGSSAILAMEAHNRFFRLNLACTAYTDSYLQRMSASTLGPEDTVLFISSTGRPRPLIDSAELAKHYGARLIAVTAADSLLADHVDICLGVKLSQFGVMTGQPNPMRFAQLFMLDCLAYQVAACLGDPAKKSLDRVRASLAALHGIVPQQPIGD